MDTIKAEIGDKDISDIMNETTYMSGTELEVTDINQVRKETIDSCQVRLRTDCVKTVDIDASYFAEKIDKNVVKIEIADNEMFDVMSKNANMCDTKFKVRGINSVGNEILESHKVRKTTDGMKHMIIDVSQVRQAKPRTRKPLKRNYSCKICQEIFDNVSDFRKHKQYGCSIIICKVCKKEFHGPDFLKHIRNGCSNTRIKMNKNNHTVYSSVVSKNSDIQNVANKYYKSATNITDLYATDQEHPQVNTNVKHLRTLSDLIVNEKVDSTDHSEKKADITDVSHEIVDSPDVKSENVDINDANVLAVTSVANETSDKWDVGNEIGITSEILASSDSIEEVCTIATSDLEEVDHKIVSCKFDECDKVFNEANVIIVKPEGKYISFDCSVCGEKFSRGQFLKSHLLWHINQYPRSICKKGVRASNEKSACKGKHSHFECCLCDEIFCDEPVLKNHLLDHEEIRNREACYVCSIPLSWHTHKELNEHLKLQIEVWTGESDDSNIFLASKGLLTHQLSSIIKPQMSANKFRCEICWKEFMSLRGYKDHKQAHQKAKSFDCNICKISFTRLCNLTRHKACIHNEYLPKKYVCPACGKAFSRISVFNLHLITHSKNKLHLCEICGLTFKHSSTLHLHRRRHSAGAYFKCDMCNKLIQSYIHLKRHIQAHIGYEWETLHKCPHPHCSKRFTTKAQIRDHVNLHAGIRPYVCDVSPLRKNQI